MVFPLLKIPHFGLLGLGAGVLAAHHGHPTTSPGSQEPGASTSSGAQALRETD